MSSGMMHSAESGLGAGGAVMIRVVRVPHLVHVTPYLLPASPKQTTDPCPIADSDSGLLGSCL